MYLTYGLPKIYSTGLTSSAGVVYLHLDGLYLVLVTDSAVQIYSGSQHRVKIGEYQKSDEDVSDEGVFFKASWCAARGALAVLVRTRQRCCIFFPRGNCDFDA